MKKMMFCAITASALATATPAMAAFVVDTGTPTGNQLNYVLATNQSLAGFFTLGSATTINSVEGYINGVSGNTVTATIYSNGATPDAANALFSATFSTVSNSNGLWQGAFGQSWLLAAGSYWLGFSNSGFNAMFNGAPSPLAKYAFTGFGGAWTVGAPPMTLGMRISGVPVVGGAVPEPASWAMMIAGFGLVGGVMRRKNGLTVTKVSYA